MSIILDTPKGGRRRVDSEREARTGMYRDAVQDTSITGHPKGLIVDTGEKEEIHYMIEHVPVTTVIKGITVNDVTQPKIVEVHKRKQDQNLKPIEEYNPQIRNIKNKQEIIVDEMYYDDGKVRVFAVGNKVHSVIYNSHGVKSYSRRINEGEGLELAVKNEEVKWLTSLNNYKMIQQGAAHIVYSVEFSQIKSRYVENIHYKTKRGDTIYKQNIIEGDQYRTDETSRRYHLENVNKILLDPKRWRDQKRQKYFGESIGIEGELEELEKAS